MTDLIVKNGRCFTKGNAPMSWMGIKRQMEGRASLLKTGEFVFEESGNNLAIWKRYFPDHQLERFVDETAIVNIGNRPPFQFKREPLWWQANATKKIDNIIADNKLYKAFAFFYDPGAGKSKSLTDMAALLYTRGIIDALIVLPPNLLVGDQWSRFDEENEGALQKDIHETIPNKAWLWKKGKKAFAEYDDLKEFEGLQSVVMNIDAAKTPDGYKLLTDFIKRHKGRVLFAIDETHLIGNPSSQRHKKCVELADRCSWKAALTGTPITKDLISTYAIFKFLDPRIIGFKYITGFKNAFCELRFNGFADQIVGHKNIDKLYQLIEPYSSRVSQEEMGLEKVYDEFSFVLSPDQKKHFDRLKKEWMTALDNGEFASVSIALSATLKMQQVSNGFLVGDDGSIQYLENARMDALKAWLETMPEQKIVIWCRFKIDAQLLMKEFGKQAVDLSGNVSSSDRLKNKDAFISDPEILYCVATPDAAGTGTDGLQHVCNRAVYYSSSEHFVNRKQSEDRVLRVGGGSTAFYTDLVGKGTPDRKILNNLKGKKDLSRMTLDDIRKLYE